MAERYAANTGNWSNVATWDGGVALPGVGDTVRANGKTVTIDQDVTVGLITTIAGGSAGTGGVFVLSPGFTLTSNISAGSTTCVTFAGGGDSVIIGNITGGVSSGRYGIEIGGSPGTLDITGNITGGPGQNAIGLQHQGDVEVNITGNITGGTSASGGAFGVYGSAGAALTLNITGNITGGRGSDTNHGLKWDALIDIEAPSFLNITGRVISGSDGSDGLVSTTATVTINGEESTSTRQRVMGVTIMGASTSSLMGRKSSIGATAVQLTNSTLKADNGIQIYAALSNTGNVYVGNSDDVTANVADSTDGFPLAPGDSMFFPMRNPSDIYLISTTSDNKVWFTII